MDEQDKKINVGSFFERNDLIDEVASAAIPTSNPAMTAVGANKLLIESLQTSIETMQTQIRDIANYIIIEHKLQKDCLLYTSPSPRDCDRSRMPSSA